MPTVELFKDNDRVIVDIGSEPETVWRNKGFSEKNKDLELPIVREELSVVDITENEHIQKRQGRPAKK